MNFRHTPTNLILAIVSSLFAVTLIYGAIRLTNHTAYFASAQKPIDLLSGSWNYLNGVSSSDHMLTVSPTGNTIQTLNGSPSQDNPPANLYGTALHIHGDFTVTTHLSLTPGTTAQIRLYDRPPIIADEFRIEPASIALQITDRELQTTIVGQQSPANHPNIAFSQKLPLSSAPSDIRIARTGNDLIVTAGQAKLTAPGKGSLFTSGNLWFGFSSDDKPYAITRLSAQSLPGGSVSAFNTQSAAAPSTNIEGLQTLATKIHPGFKVGAAAALGPWVSDADYAKQLSQNFGMITIENAMKPQFISPRPYEYTFKEADALIALAHKNGMSVHGHTLAFSEALPDWMRNLPTATPDERAAATRMLLDYVTHVTTHFKGQLASLDVINEPLDPNQGTSLQQNVWYKAMGPDYVVRVSQAVHAVDPNLPQYVNENGAEMAGGRQDALLKLIQHINDAGGSITGVGLQTHVYDMDTDAIDATKLNDTINRFGAAGFKVRISENDVTDDAGAKAQAAQYAAVFNTCLHNQRCVSYTTWGVNDRYDWFVDDNGALAQGHDLLFNGSKPTDAYRAIKNSMQ